MAYPVGLPIRNVSFGSAVVMESGNPLDMSVTIRASRTLVHRPSGTPLVAAQTVFLSGSDGSGMIPLPVCDSPNMGLGNGTAITLGANQLTHTYTATVRYLSGETIVSTATIGPFAVRTSDPEEVDLDDLLVVGGSTAGTGLPSYLTDALAAAERAEEAADRAEVARDLAEVPVYTSMTAVGAAITSGTLVNGDIFFLET